MECVPTCEIMGNVSHITKHTNVIIYLQEGSGLKVTWIFKPSAVWCYAGWKILTYVSEEPPSTGPIRILKAKAASPFGTPVTVCQLTQHYIPSVTTLNPTQQ